jgi:hypothetical protein
VPAAVAFIEKVDSVTQGFGVVLTINRPVFESMLPVIAFACLISAHDFTKTKYGSTPIGQKIL